MQTNILLEKDHQTLFHPCSQMKDYETFKPLHVVSAQGDFLYLKNGQKIIDACSSWWCKSLGHGHPRLKAALIKQMEKFEHVILANTSNDIIVELSEQLAMLQPGLSKVFYAGDGSCAVEVALKMSVHARKITGESKRTLFAALENGYHGETAGALSVSDLGLYREPYLPLLFNTHFISPLPYVQTTENALWQNCEAVFHQVEEKLLPIAHQLTAIIIEPIVQGAGGMRFYSQDFLRRLRYFAKMHGIHLIADEIMSGLGRTGKMLACHHAMIQPDFVCLSKGLTAGWMPFSATLMTDAIYDLFYDDYQSGKSFLHSHTFSGNALAASLALEVLKITQEESLCARALEIGEIMRQNMQEIANKTGRLHNVRGVGAMVAADLVIDGEMRLGYEIYKTATKLGALLRPLGNTIYWFPPLNVSFDTLGQLKDITLEAIKKN
ncbi:MAG: adenosylmethionine--8-amino-7-oxononanoate transaminase [Gammaproteobacteria bacterium RIFCSPHIGHO2_12_FULL_38_14]|nr:MAG: adenosylmethionine--8-amino-7-oxononanoate transaminase [Gammaproteobacteria bacterium RIFCSPHIGHO2_12_FULL_38_14]